MKDHLHESHFIDMPDDQLKESLGYLWERIKSLSDSKASDPEVERMKGELKAYLKDNFDVELKRLKKMLKAARVIAGMRNITWKAPNE